MFKPLHYGLALLSVFIISVLPYAYAANSRPVASNQTVSSAEDSTFTINLTATDANKDALTYQIVSKPLKGSITAQQGNNITYKPNEAVEKPSEPPFCGIIRHRKHQNE